MAMGKTSVGVSRDLSLSGGGAPVAGDEGSPVVAVGPSPSPVEAVTDAANGQEAARTLRVALQLRAELLHEVVDGPLGAVGVRTPHARGDGVAAAPAPAGLA